MHPALRVAVRPAAARRCFATAAHPIASSSVTSSTAQTAAIPLSNVEAQWEKLSAEDQVVVHQQLEALQKKDWKELSIDEKKAAYYVAFGPHGPRTPVNPPGTSAKVTAGVFGLIAAAAAVFATVRALAPPPPRTITKEWEDAALERAREMNINPISGVSSEGYAGKGFSTHK